MISPLAFGFVLGLQHALEADHLAAISSLIAGKSDIRKMTGQGLVWGLGHLVTLTLVGGFVLLGQVVLDERVANALSIAVGVMLVALGLNAFHRLFHDHVHIHRHGTDRHSHAHSHLGDKMLHPQNPRDEDHHGLLLVRPFAIGIMHGLAGSGAMAVLAASTTKSAFIGTTFLVTFGFGSLIGMGIMSILIAVPLTLTAQSLVIANRCLQAGAAFFSFIIGISSIHGAFYLG